MIKTYDEALKTLNDIRTYLVIGKANDCVQELDKVAKYFINEKHKENPTLLKCIKEWNEKGFDVDVYAVEIVIHNYSTVDKEEDEIEISIRLDKKAIFYVNDVELSFELHNLLSKTLKALEDKDDK